MSDAAIRTLNTAAADFLDAAAVEFKHHDPAKIAKLLRGKIDGLIFEVAGYGTQKELRDELGDCFALLILIAHKKGVSLQALANSIATATER